MNWTKNKTMHDQFYTYETEYKGYKININEASGCTRNNELMIDLYMFEVSKPETQFYYHGTDGYSTLDEAKSASISWIKENGRKLLKRITINGIVFYYDLETLEKELIQYLTNKEWNEESYTIYIDESQGIIVY